MRRFLEQIVEILDRRIQPGRGFALYIVTPRQVRHVVRRRLLRSLNRQMATRNVPLFSAKTGVEPAGNAVRCSTSVFRIDRHVT